MEAYQLLNLGAGVAALLILCVLVLRIAAATLRQRRAGTPGTMVAAATTSQLIGFGLALLGAVGGGRIAFAVLGALELSAVAHLTVQVCAALAASWLIGRVYFSWLAQSVYHWFAGEESAAQVQEG